MTFDRSKITVYSASAASMEFVSPIVPTCSDDAPQRPFTVLRNDRRTKERIYSKAEAAIIDLLDEAYDEFFRVPSSALPRRSRHYVKVLVRLGLDRSRSQRVIAVLQRIATSGNGWTDQSATEIATILQDALPPIAKPPHPVAILPLDHVRREYGKCGWDTRVLIEGRTRTLVLLDQLHREIARIPVREGDEVHAIDIFAALEVSERRQKPHK
jgi:hypothetical protein